jgi:chitosanase
VSVQEVVFPSVTTVTPGALVLYFHTMNNTGPTSMSVPPAGLTKVTEAPTVGRYHVGYAEPRPTAGSTGTRTFGQTSATARYMGGIRVVLRPRTVASINPPIVSAGADAQFVKGSTFTRTATETANGAPITGRNWSIVSGPSGPVNSIGTAAALSWSTAVSSGNSPANGDITEPVYKEIALQLTSTAENSTKDWTTAYRYIEDIGDGRGYTGGIVGFCSATFDMEILLKHYQKIAPGNSLVPFLDEFATISAQSTQTARNNMSHTLLDPLNFVEAWQNAADTDPLFRQAQRDERDRVYWAPALSQAVADGVGPLGLAILYDISVNHGPGTDSQSFGGIVTTARTVAAPPSEGGNEVAYLNALTNAREAVLIAWGDITPDPATPPTTTPTVTLTVPANGATVSGTAVTLNVTVTNTTSVAYFVDGTQVDSDGVGDNADGFRGTFDSTTLTNGTHQVTATATGPGGTTTSAPISITISNVATPPTPTASRATLLQHWKLQLPINSDNAGNVDEITRDQLVAGYTSEWFTDTADGKGFKFHTPVNGKTTSGSQYPRTELREMNSNGTTTAGWNSGGVFDGTVRTFQANYKILHLPTGDRETTLFQIHNGDTEVTTVRTTETAGGIRVAARKNGSSITPYFNTNYQYGTAFDIKVEVSSRVKIWYNGVLQHDYPFSDLTVGPSGLFYLKAGNYLQANTTTASASEYGDVEMRPVAGQTTFLTRS